VERIGSEIDKKKPLPLISAASRTFLLSLALFQAAKTFTTDLTTSIATIRTALSHHRQQHHHHQKQIVVGKNETETGSNHCLLPHQHHQEPPPALPTPLGQLLSSSSAPQPPLLCKVNSGELPHCSLSRTEPTQTKMARPGPT